MPSEEPGHNGQNNAGDAKDKNNWVQMGNYAQLAFVFPAATVVGWLIGAGIDKWLHTTWIYIVGLLLGIVAGFVELIRTVSKNS
jgi:F0F1-type ATP synthase assembly protein I